MLIMILMIYLIQRNTSSRVSKQSKRFLSQSLTKISLMEPKTKNSNKLVDYKNLVRMIVKKIKKKNIMTSKMIIMKKNKIIKKRIIESHQIKIYPNNKRSHIRLIL